MVKKLILAVAGAGKTYHISRSIDPTKRNLIIAYTHENIYNIQRELCEAFDKIPAQTTVVTFDSFIYHNVILPYEPSIAEFFSTPDFKSKGICMVDPPSKNIKGKKIHNPEYKNKNELAHYVKMDIQQYYCDTLSELALNVKKGSYSLIKRAAARLNLFFDTVSIDEFQDFRKYDFDLIIGLAKHLQNIVLVGDYYQHSVSGKNNSGKPFKKGSCDVSYFDFVKNMKDNDFEIDEVTLSKSRRCSSIICDFVNKKLRIPILSSGLNEGSVKWADDDATRILEDDKIVKLVYRNSSKYSFSAMNWSYSKGDTFNCTCVILTDNLNGIDEDGFDIGKIQSATVNRFYVAMTRSCGDVYLMKSSTFKNYEESFIKQ